MHGHSDKWNSKDIYERFGYEYSESELAEWAPKIADLASGASTTHVLFNNCYRNYAQVNAQQLEERLGLGLSFVACCLLLLACAAGSGHMTIWRARRGGQPRQTSAAIWCQST
jgi:hypothetical protein